MHEAQPGHLLLRDDVPQWIRDELQRKGYEIETAELTSGPITAIYFDQLHDTMWGGASDFGDDYGIAW
jgi:gamma-glutamyltranspeptidase/glutathione hydrolase